MQNKSVNHDPILLKPAAKDYLWGGNRIKAEFGKQIPVTPLAETWECSTHPDGPSVVDSGPYRGMTLRDYIRNCPEVLGTHPRKLFKDDIPVLIKLIDAKKNLSVQVHPTDAYASEKENGQLGKTEMWYVLSAGEKAELIYGFHHRVNRKKLKMIAESGEIEKYLQHVPVKRDDVFMIQAGTVHAIGAGCLIAEIQENSNLTYRLYDYNRIGKDGKKRPIHIEKAAEVADLEVRSVPRQPLRLLKYRRGMASEQLASCQYFSVERVLLNTEIVREFVPFQTDSDSFQVFLCIDGCGMLMMADETIPMFKGDCIFVPADSNIIRMMGKAQLLKVRC